MIKSLNGDNSYSNLLIERRKLMGYLPFHVPYSRYYCFITDRNHMTYVSLYTLKYFITIKQSEDYSPFTAIMRLTHNLHFGIVWLAELVYNSAVHHVVVLSTSYLKTIMTEFSSIAIPDHGSSLQPWQYHSAAITQAIRQQ